MVVVELQYRDRQGKPMSVVSWWTHRRDPAYVHIARSQLPHCEVVTTWTGYDDSDDIQDSTPLVFQTLVVGGTYDGRKDRYACEAGALRGHERVVHLCMDEYRRLLR